MKFYETVLGVQLYVVDCDTEKMAFSPEENEQCPGAISWVKDFYLSEDGVLVHFQEENLEITMTVVEINGGKITLTKIKIEAEFCLHSVK